MADSGADSKDVEQRSPDTGQVDSSDGNEVSSAGDASANGDAGAAASNHSLPRADAFPGPVKPARFIPSAAGGNPFAARPSLKSDVVSSSACTPFTVGTSSPAKFVLRPSALSAHTQNVTQQDADYHASVMSPILKPAKLPDPTRPGDQEVTEKENKESSPDKPDKDKHKEPPDSSTTDNIFQAAIQNHEHKLADSSCMPSSSNSNNHTESDSDNILGQNLTEKVTGVHSSPTSAGTGSTGFVFGENLADRVLKSEGGDKGDDRCASPDSTEQGLDNAKTLEESARDYQATHGKKTELHEVEVRTGEENESNVLQANGKLFVFDGEQQNWVERGRGLFRLNDMRCFSSGQSRFQSRLLMRTQGSLRLILNTKVWPGMTVERASVKSIRMTGTDSDEGVKVFLLMTNVKDNENILRALDWRIQQLRVQEDDVQVDTEDRVVEKRKADTESPTEEYSHKKPKKSEDDGLNFRREESDSSVVDPETEVSSESHASSFALRTDSD